MRVGVPSPVPLLMRTYEYRPINGERLTAAMARHGYTDAVLALVLKRKLGTGTTHATMFGWRTGKHRPPPEAVAAMAEILETTTGYLYGEDL